MWIMLNNRPFNIMEIEDISGLITIDSSFLLKNKLGCKFKEVGALNEYFLPHESWNKTIDELHEEVENNNTVYGYFFYINIRTTIECYVNNIFSGTKPGTGRIYSKVYSTKEAAQTALEYLLSEINEVYNKLVKVEI